MTESQTETSEEVNDTSSQVDPDANPVILTAKAVEMVKIALKEEGMLETHGLRVAVQGGGCSGLQYALDFAESSRPGELYLRARRAKDLYRFS